MPLTVFESNVASDTTYWLEHAGKRIKFWRIMSKQGRQRPREYEVYYDNEQDARRQMFKLIDGA